MPDNAPTRGEWDALSDDEKWQRYQDARVESTVARFDYVRTPLRTSDPQPNSYAFTYASSGIQPAIIHWKKVLGGWTYEIY